MRVSIVIAAHNEGDRLWRTVNSCFETVSGDFEIVIADDASWDGSVEEVLQRFPRACVIRNESRQSVSATKDMLHNQLRMVRKNLTDGTWRDWVERCRACHAGELANHPEGLWATAWRLFEERRLSVERERASLLGQRVRDEFWFAERFELPWPRLQPREGGGNRSSR